MLATSFVFTAPTWTATSLSRLRVPPAMLTTTPDASTVFVLDAVNVTERCSLT